MRPPIRPEAEEIIGGYYHVHDHGFVALLDVMGGDEDVERAARVSYGKGTRKTSETRGLIRYLRRHHHTTPSEMVELKFHCRMPIFVARQWVRHRTANINEESGRYSVLRMDFYTPTPEDFQKQSQGNKQGRSGQLPAETYAHGVRGWEIDRGHARRQYEWLLGMDVARELARIDLPLSTYTQWYWKIDLHNLLHFLSLRVHEHAQPEIRAYANIMAAMVQKVAPITFDAWIDYQVCARSFSRVERNILHHLIKWDPQSRCLSAREVETGAGNFRTHVTDQMMQEAGLSTREIDEFLEKLESPGYPNFTLPEMFPPEHFAPPEEESPKVRTSKQGTLLL